MRNIVFTACCIWQLAVFAQDTIYLKDLGKNGLAEHIDSANFYKVITKSGDLYAMKVYRMDHVLYLAGTLESVSPDIEQGDFTYYFPNGKIYKSGKFVHGEKDGEWVYNNYKYVLNKKLYYKEGVLAKIQCFDEKGNVLRCRETAGEIMPQYPGGPEALIKYLMANVVYPKACRDSLIQGKVIVKFYLDIDGTVHGARIIKGAHPLMNKEALRVIGTMPAWSPGIQRGEYVRVYYTIPVSFKLQ